MPDALWQLPERIERANADGPRYNQTELAEQAGITQSVISKLSTRSNLRALHLDTIVRVAAALDVTVGWLLGETPAATPRRPPRPRRRVRPAKRRRDR